VSSSNPHGNNEEGWSAGRYGAFHDIDTWRRSLTGAGFAKLSHYYRPPGRPRAQQPWLATLRRKPARRPAAVWMQRWSSLGVIDTASRTQWREVVPAEIVR